LLAQAHRGQKGAGQKAASPEAASKQQGKKTPMSVETRAKIAATVKARHPEKSQLD
jgi:hypothetical protein